MKAIRTKCFGTTDVFTLEHLEKPTPQSGQICIRIKAASFNPVDYKIRAGWYDVNQQEDKTIDLVSFSPEFCSRNQSPIAFQADANVIDLLTNFSCLPSVKRMLF